MEPLPRRSSLRPRWLAVLAVALASCGGVSVHQDYDPTLLPKVSAWRSFDWFPGGRELSGNPRVDSPLIDERVRAAITGHLGARGFEKVTGRTPDFYVNYHLSVQQRISSSGIDTYYGVGSYGSWGGVSLGTGTSPVRTYDEGTLVIDVVDAASRQLVWRGSGSEAVRPSATPQESTEQIQRVVGAILEQFPPAP